MAFPLGSDPEEQLKTNLRDWLRDNDIEAAIDGEAHGTRTHVIIKSADETRTAIDATCDGKRAEWQAWRVVIDVISDDKNGGRRRRARGATPKVASTVAALRALFRHSNWPARNEAGIFTAQLEKDADSRDGVTYLNPFNLTCNTFTFLE